MSEITYHVVDDEVWREPTSTLKRDYWEAEVLTSVAIVNKDTNTAVDEGNKMPSTVTHPLPTSFRHSAIERLALTEW
jgi:hypothetical protein